MAASLVVHLPSVPDFYAGTRHTFNFTVADLDADPTGATPRNITSDVIKWTLSKIGPSGYSSKYTLQKTSATAGAITKTDPANGKCAVDLYRVDTEKLLGNFHQELEAFDSFGESVMLAVGDFSILLNVKNT